MPCVDQAQYLRVSIVLTDVNNNRLIQYFMFGTIRSSHHTVQNTGTIFYVFSS